MAIFVCKASKDVHKEVVSELSTKAFLAAFKRMIARRALPSDIYCDNAINFAGAANHLHELKKFVPLTSLTFILSLLGHHISAGCGKRRWKARRDCWTYSYSFIVWSKWLLSNYSGALPERQITSVNFTNLQRFDVVTTIKQEVWRCWSLEYINELPTRTKWSQPSTNINVGSLVIIHDDNRPHTLETRPHRRRGSGQGWAGSSCSSSNSHWLLL